MKFRVLNYVAGTLTPILLLLQSPLFADQGSWQPLPKGEVTKIAFGSCTRHMLDQPIWNTIVDNNPDLFIHLGDTAYPDVNDEMTGLIEPWPNPETLDRIRDTYQIAASKPGFQRLQSQVPVLAVWDDHDYGINDGGGNFPLKEQTQQLFLDHYGEPDNSWRRATAGIYDSHIFGSDGKRVQVILLDIRYFRSPPLLDARSGEEKQVLNIAGRYAPSNDPEATVLGRDQWVWLEEQLQKPAEVRLIASGYPVVPDQLGRDAWGNFPMERQRLFDLVGKTNAKGALFLTGDVHFSEISRSDQGPYPMIDFTSSPLAAPSTGNEDFVNSYRVSDTYAKNNFGLIQINWNAEPAPEILMSTVAENGLTVFEYAVSLSTLQ